MCWLHFSIEVWQQRPMQSQSRKQHKQRGLKPYIWPCVLEEVTGQKVEWKNKKKSLFAIITSGCPRIQVILELSKKWRVSLCLCNLLSNCSSSFENLEEMKHCFSCFSFPFLFCILAQSRFSMILWNLIREKYDLKSRNAKPHITFLGIVHHRVQVAKNGSKASRESLISSSDPSEAAPLVTGPLFILR